MTDTIIAAIASGALAADNISFDRIRELGGRDYGQDAWRRLGRGRAILGAVEELDQYLYSYAPMTKSQWNVILAGATLPPEPTQIIDYGCGQGLATALLFDQFGQDLVNTVQKVVLIEPSTVALNRAGAIVSCYSAAIDVVQINKKLEDLTPEQLRANSGVHMTHLFSNVLDICGYNQLELLDKMFQTEGNHLVLAVSHDRNFNGGSTRFEELDRAMLNQNYEDWLKVSNSKIDRFKCAGGKSAISWMFQAEVKCVPF